MSTVITPELDLEPQAPAAPERLLSLDVFRGMTIAGMIVVNQLPGNINYAPLEHAEWNGWTHTDLIFPFFLFIVGTSMALSFASRRKKGDDDRKLALHSTRRALTIYAIGFFLAAFPFYEGILHRVRIMGVLQRIALVYLIAAPIYLFTSKRVRAFIVLAFLVGYDLLMHFVPVPGYGAGVLTQAGSLSAYIDRYLMLGHLWRPLWDPEGLLSTMGAIATCLIGTFVGELFLQETDWKKRLRTLLISGVVFMALGYLWNPWFPINKNLWTSSYVLFTAGYAMVALAACHWAVDVQRWKRLWSAPFIWLGVNPILAFTLSTFAAKNFFIIYKTSLDGRMVSYAGYVYIKWFRSVFADQRNASLTFALTYLLIWVLVMGWFYRKKIFLRV
jgi:predicted acyltransferase